MKHYNKMGEENQSTTTDMSAKQRAIENAKAAAMKRAKVVKRVSLAREQGREEGGNTYKISKLGNMISVTGYEHDGLQVSASSVHTYAFFFFIAICCCHVFTRNTPYRSANPFKKPGPPPTIANQTANTTGDLI